MFSIFADAEIYPVREAYISTSLPAFTCNVLTACPLIVTFAFEGLVITVTVYFVVGVGGVGPKYSARASRSITASPPSAIHRRTSGGQRPEAGPVEHRSFQERRNGGSQDEGKHSQVFQGGHDPVDELSEARRDGVAEGDLPGRLLRRDRAEGLRREE